MPTEGAQPGRRPRGGSRRSRASSGAVVQAPTDVLAAAEYLLALSRTGLTAPLDDLAVIEAELRQLRAARHVLVDWLRDLQDRGWAGGAPTPFLRAWSESTRQVLQLLRARRELVDAGEAGLEADALDALEELPGLRQLLHGGTEDTATTAAAEEAS